MSTPATAPEASSTPAAEGAAPAAGDAPPASATDGAGGDAAAGEGAPPADDTAPPAAAKAKEDDAGDGKTKEPEADPAKDPAKPEDAAKPRPNLTARMAALSTEKRVAERKAREAEAGRTAAEAKATAAERKASEIDELLVKARGDRKLIPALLKRAGLEFEEIVNAYAEQNEEPRELTADDKIAALEAKIEEDRAARAKESQDREAERKREETARTAREEENARLEYIAGISETIKKVADKFEICARLGDEAATDVFDLVIKTWDKAGRPKLMPGEFEEAVLSAIDVQELRYEERGKKLQKQLKANGTANGAGNGKSNGSNGANGAGKDSKQPATNGALSDKDAEIAQALIDKTSAGNQSSRPKPRTINSSLGGSAPPTTPARGTMDPKEALREVLQGLPR